LLDATLPVLQTVLLLAPTSATVIWKALCVLFLSVDGTAASSQLTSTPPVEPSHGL
jgi:hypothetical protein